MFSWHCSIHELGHFGGFWGPNSPKYCQIIPKFSPEVVIKETQTVSEEFWKISNFYRNRRYPKFARLGPTLTPFFPLKMAEIWKNKKIYKLNSAIGLSKYVNAIWFKYFSFNKEISRMVESKEISRMVELTFLIPLVQKQFGLFGGSHCLLGFVKDPLVRYYLLVLLTCSQAIDLNIKPSSLVSLYLAIVPYTVSKNYQTLSEVLSGVSTDSNAK